MRLHSGHDRPLRLKRAQEALRPVGEGIGGDLARFFYYFSLSSGLKYDSSIIPLPTSLIHSSGTALSAFVSTSRNSSASSGKYALPSHSSLSLSAIAFAHLS